MSEQVPMDTLPLFAPAAPEEVRAIHERMEKRNAEFLTRLRKLLALRYADGSAISTDDVWERMEEWRMSIPEGSSPNILGSIFSGWDRATAVGWTRSRRAGANGNLLRTWSIR